MNSNESANIQIATHPLEYSFSKEREPHLGRMKAILAKHPEVSKLTGPTPTTIVYLLGIVGMQLGLAVALGQTDAPWWLSLLLAYTIGAFANHALWVLIHEATHNLIFKKSSWNCWAAIIANFPIVFPSAISFRIYHIQHHLHQGDPRRDADLPLEAEARFVGQSFFRKALWLLIFPISQSFRVQYLEGIRFWSPWVVTNMVAQVALLVTMYALGGWTGLFYLTLCSFVSVGLHPVGARWIQEHYLVKAPQETYSYYGPLNTVAFNVGYHNEHHDFMGIAWSRLPKLKAIAPEFYETLHWHPSWSKLLWQFLTDRNLTLFSRMTRLPLKAGQKAAGEAVRGNVPAGTAPVLS
jgi:sphingolipid delta-4 desaturase